MLSLAEQYLVDLIKTGDKKSFEFLFKSYYSGLCKYAKTIVHNETIAEDLVMDIFVRIWEYPEKLVITTSLSGYLYQIVHNYCLNYLTRKHKPFSELNQEVINKLNTIVLSDPSSDPLTIINISELSVKIKQSIEYLPAECQKVFVMSRIEELSHKEIALKLGISENTVKVQIYRALFKLNLLLKEFLTN